MSETAPPVVHPSGDAALVIEFGDKIDRKTSARVLTLSRRIRSANPSGALDIVPTFRSLLICFDPARTNRTELERDLRPLFDDLDETTVPQRLWRIPAVYGESYGPDLEAVARHADMSVDDVVAVHTQQRYHVYMIGFLPGYPYMGDLPTALRLPRLEQPRTRVPARSVAITQQLTGIYPVEAPGGWHLIARTPVALFDPASAQPSLVGAGDTVQFEPIATSDYEAIERDVAHGRYRVPVEDIEDA